LLFVSGANIDLKFNKEEDAAILGSAFSNGYITVNKKVEGNFNFTGHPENLNLLFALHFGKVMSITNAVDGSLCIFYKGSNESCKIEKTGTNLVLKSGNEGSEVVDLTVDLTVNDTLTKIKNTIQNNTTNYLVYTIGNTNNAINISDFNMQTKSKSFNSQTCKIDSLLNAGYRHKIGTLKIGEDKKSFSFIQAIGNNWEAFTGLKAGQLTLDIPNGGLITGTSNVLGKEKINVSAITSYFKETTKPIASAFSKVYANGELLGYNNVSFDYNPNLFAEVEGGSFFQGESQHGKKSQFSINITYHFDDVITQKIKQKFEQDEVVEVCVVIDSNDKVLTNVNYNMFFRFSKCAISECKLDMGGEVFNLPTKFEVLEPDANFRPVEVEVLSVKQDLLA